VTETISKLRAALPSDAEALSVLLGQLGYPATLGEMPRRLSQLESHPGAAARVADVNGRVVGVATVHVFPSIHSTVPAAWLTTLVVDEGARGQGIGRQLVAWAEEWARSHGATRISLTSALHRDDAREFYLGLGYIHSGRRFTKTLSEA